MATQAPTSTNQQYSGEVESLPAARHTDNTRLEAFSDAMFGFAATLLVVSLEVPTSYDSLARNLWEFPAFGASFGALAALWSMHRQFFRRFPIGDGHTVVLNTVLMFLILFFVYPLKFLSRTFFLGVLQPWRPEQVKLTLDQVGGMFVIYGAGWAALFVCFALMYAHAAKLARRYDFGPDDVQLATDRAGVNLVIASVSFVSMVLAVAKVGLRYGVPGWTYTLVGPAVSMYWAWRRRRTAARAGI